MMRTQKKSIEKLTGGHNLQKTEMQANILHPSQQPVDMYWHQLGAKCLARYQLIMEQPNILCFKNGTLLAVLF